MIRISNPCTACTFTGDHDHSSNARVHQLLTTLPRFPSSQVEIDFKAECKAGNVIESLCNPLVVPPTDGATSQASTDSDESRLQYLHLLRRCDEEGCVELVRARTTWRKV